MRTIEFSTEALNKVYVQPSFSVMAALETWSAFALRKFLQDVFVPSPTRATQAVAGLSVGLNALN